MEPEAMGRVLVEATVENLEDAWEIRRGLRAPDQARRIVIHEALVDSGATGLSLPTWLIRQLGLSKRVEKRVTTSAGEGRAALYEPVRLTTPIFARPLLF